MTVSDTAGMIRTIDAMTPCSTADQCADVCWCNNTPRTPVWVFRWAPGQVVLRFPLKSEAA